MSDQPPTLIVPATEGTVSDEQLDMVTFIRRRDYQVVKELGHGACGRTLLLYDQIVNEQFVCKKFAPTHQNRREELFHKFLREIKILVKVSHLNVVRVFNWYVYSESFAGYILMEFVDGCNIKDAIKKEPQRVEHFFKQTIDGFCYLESVGILHRDIRPSNIMVSSSGTVKIIDFGFGKEVLDFSDYDKSVSVAKWCDDPDEFSEKRYDFCTEVYFVGQLFWNILSKVGIQRFKYQDVLNRMCRASSQERISSFSDVRVQIEALQTTPESFTDEEKMIYRDFMDCLAQHVAEICADANYESDFSVIVKGLEEVLKNSVLEEFLPKPYRVAQCFIDGNFQFYSGSYFRTYILQEFVDLLKRSSGDKVRTLLVHVYQRLDEKVRYDEPTSPNPHDIPF